MAIAPDDNIVGGVEALALPLGGDDRQAAVRFHPRDAASIALASIEAALSVHRVAVRGVGVVTVDLDPVRERTIS